MKRRIQVNSSQLKVGNTFYFAGYESTLYRSVYRIIAQGPEVFGYVELGHDVDSDYTDIITHKDVWINAPRTKVGEFEVGEKIKIPRFISLILTVTAVGKDNSLMTREDGYECIFTHEEECEEVSDDE